MKTVKYFARLRIINDYPCNGSVEWCVVDNLGGCLVMDSEENARIEAAERNKTIAERTAA